MNLWKNIAVDTLMAVVAEDTKYWVNSNLPTNDLGIRSCTKRVLTHLGLELEVVTEAEFKLLWDMVTNELHRHSKLKEANS